MPRYNRSSLLKVYTWRLHADAWTGLCARTLYVRENVAKAPGRMWTVWGNQRRRQKQDKAELLQGLKSKEKIPLPILSRTPFISFSSQAWWLSRWRRRGILSSPPPPCMRKNLMQLFKTIFPDYSGHVMQCAVSVYKHIKRGPLLKKMSYCEWLYSLVGEHNLTIK